MTTIKKQYNTINYILWGLKFPEILATLVIIVGLGSAILGYGGYYIPIVAIIIRVVLFIVRLALINEKRKHEGLVKK
jgi:hypothetical protein